MVLLPIDFQNFAPVGSLLAQSLAVDPFSETHWIGLLMLTHGVLLNSQPIHPLSCLQPSSAIFSLLLLLLLTQLSFSTSWEHLNAPSTHLIIKYHASSPGPRSSKFRIPTPLSTNPLPKDPCARHELFQAPKGGTPHGLLLGNPASNIGRGQQKATTSPQASLAHSPM